METNLPPDSAGPVDLLCPNCQAIIQPNDKFCTACGARVNVSKEEQEKLNKAIQTIESRLEKLDTRVTEGRSALWVVAVISAIRGLYYFLVFKDAGGNATGVLIASIAVALLFVAISQITRYKPFVGLLSGLIIFVLLVVGLTYMKLVSWLELFLALLVIGGIVRGVISAKEAEQIRDKIKS